MAYVAPFIDAAGLHVPAYPDIVAYETEQFLTVYGSSLYTGVDSTDGEWLSIFSLMINDAMSAAQLAYNARSPLTAVGADLDSIVKVNGIVRLAASYSTATLTVTGTAGAVINNGVASDANGYFWSLPTSATIPNGGTLFVTGTCQTSGAIAAPAGTITGISTPTSGWSAVTNASNAIVGSPVETDSQLRARQSISVALSSKTLLAGTVSAIATVPGVTRYGTIGIENPTGGVDVYGNPAHSISMVVEGGASLAIATAIYQNKSIGCYTNGNTSVAVTDPYTGNVANINFFRPTYNTMAVTLVLHGLTGFTTATATAVQVAVAAYLNALQIGEELTISGLYGAALAVMPSILTPQFSIQAVYASLLTAATSLGAFTIASGGTGYVVGDTLTVTQGSASGGSLKVTLTGAGGVVTGLAFSTPGTGYTVANGVATTGGTGTGCTVNLTGLGANTSADIPTAFNAVVAGATNSVYVQVV